MKNKLSDLHNHLFAQMERLSDETLKGEALSEEISRSEAVTRVSQQIIGNVAIVLKAEQMKNDVPVDSVSRLKQLTG